MFRWFFSFLIFCFHTCGDLHARLVESSAPYLSGDTFRNMCDWHFDEISKSFPPEQVQPGDLIFVKTDKIAQFFKEKHPFILNHYILVSHNSDHPAPGPGLQFLDDPKLVAWFAQNIEYRHPKLHPIPIGIANKMWPHGNISMLETCLKQIKVLPKTTWMYMNFNIQTCAGERKKAFEYFRNNPYCTISSGKSWAQYLLDVGKARFIISPRGNGLDCHRTWEALYMGAIPIVKESPMDELFTELPVLIVKEWNDVSFMTLNSIYEKYKSQSFQLQKLYAPYWQTLLQTYKEQTKQSTIQK